MRMGVIGVNHPHSAGHLQALEAAPEIDRLLIWDPDPALAQAAVEKCGKAELAPSADALFDDPDLPALGIFVRDSESGALNLRALEAGKWVYGDKPGGMSASELQLLVRAAERTGTHFCPCYAHRLTAASNGLTSLFRDHAIGDIWSFEAVWMTSSVALRGADHWLFHREHSAGGILTWLACHWLDLLRHLFASEAESVMAMVVTKTDAGVDVEDTASLILRFENGAIGTVRAGYSLSPFTGYLDSDLYLQFEGSEGSITYLPQGETRTILRTNRTQYADWTRPAVVTAPREGYGGDVLAGFLQAVQGRGEPPASEVDAWRVMQIIEAAYQSSATGRKVQLH